MDTFDIREAETHLSELVERAAPRGAFVIAKAGRPMVRVVPFAEAEPATRSRSGFLEGQIDVPDDFKALGREEIERMIYGEPDD